MFHKPAKKLKNSYVTYERTERGRRWMLTVNFEHSDNWLDMCVKSQQTLNKFEDGIMKPPVSYAIYQPERGVEGRLHIQYYLEFDHEINLRTLRYYLGTHVYAIRCRDDGAAGQARCINYCRKTGENGRCANGRTVELGEPMKL